MTWEGAGAEERAEHARIVAGAVVAKLSIPGHSVAGFSEGKVAMVLPLIFEALNAASSAATEKERERCAKIAEALSDERHAAHEDISARREPDQPGRYQWLKGGCQMGHDIAEAIRGDEQEGAPQGEQA